MRARYWLPALVLAVVVLTGCLTNPITGRMGPSWDVPVQVPLISGEVTVDDLVADYLEEYLPEEYDPAEPLIVEFSETVTVDVSELGEAADLPLDDFAVEVVIEQSEIVKELSSVELPLAGLALDVPDITEGFDVPVAEFLGDLSYSKELDLGFNAAEFASGILVITIENDSPAVLEGLRLEIPNMPGVIWNVGNLTAGADATEAFSLTGEFEGPFVIQFELAGVDGDAGQVSVTVKMQELKAQHVVGLERDEDLAFEFTAEVEGLPYEEVSFADGEFEVSLSLLDVGTVELESATKTGSAANLLTEGLAGVTLVEGEEITFRGKVKPANGIVSTLDKGARAAVAGLAGVRVSQVKGSTGFESVEIEQSMVDWDTGFDFTSLTFAKGKLSFSVDGLTTGHMQVVEAAIDGTSLQGAGNEFSLADVTIKQDSEITLTAGIVGTELGFAGEDITVTVAFADVELTEVALTLEKQEIDASELDIEPVSLSFDWGEYGALLDWIANIENEVTVIVKNPSGIPVDLKGLDLKFTGKDGSEHIISLKEADETRTDDVTTYTISSNSFVEIFRSEPRQVELDGYFVVGSDEDIIIDPNAVIEVTVKTRAQAVLAINYDADFEDFVLEAREVAQQAEFDDALEFMSQPGLFAEVTNGIPLGVQIWLDLSTSEDDWEDAVEIDLGIIPAAETDAQGRAAKPQTGLLELPVDDDVQNFLKQGGFVRVRIALASEGQTGTKQIAITPSDAVAYRIWADVRIKVNQ